MSLKIRYWILIAATALILVVLLQNIEQVTLQVLFWSISMSLIVLVLLVLLLGFALGYVSHVLFARRRAGSQRGETSPKNTTGTA